MFDATVADVNVPPRQVREWTTVPGHDVRLLRRTSDGSPLGVCSCGERRRNGTEDWRAEHLSAAWPVLVPRGTDESVDAWRTRLADVLDQARAEDERLSENLDRRMGVRPGEACPVITEEHVAASQRVEILEHQLTQPSFGETS